jgi:hypothetical protein
MAIALPGVWVTVGFATATARPETSNVPWSPAADVKTPGTDFLSRTSTRAKSCAYGHV